MAFDPNRFINDFGGLTVAATHGSPWKYDTYVPIMFAGAGISPSLIYRYVEPLAIAPTLSLIVGGKLPSGSSGKILEEVL